MFVYVFAVAIVLLVAYVLSGRKNLPPGPYGLPILGYTPFLGRNPMKTLTDLKKKYGNVMQVSFGQKPVIILNNYEAVKEAFVTQGEVFSGRPNLFIPKTFFDDNGILFADGPIWKQQKRFSLQTLKEFGIGRTSLEDVVMEQVEKLTEKLTAKHGMAVPIEDLFFVPVMNIIWGITAGKTFDLNDNYMNNFKTVFDNLSQTGFLNIINFVPKLRNIIPGGLGYDKSKQSSEEIQKFLTKEVENHAEKFQETNIRDFTDSYLAKINSENKNGRNTPPFDKNGLSGTLFDLFVAGANTMATVLVWALLYVASRPEIQKKIQEELDEHVSKESSVTHSMKSLLPYTDATLMEVQRCATIAPLAVPHRTLKPTTLMGYDIPKNSTVYANLYAIHHDKNYWGDPEVFRPERFLDENGKVKNLENFVPFSTGPRMCIAESLAKMEMFLFFTCLLRRFTFELNPNQPKPSEEPVIGAFLKPEPFSCIVKCR